MFYEAILAMKPYYEQMIRRTFLDFTQTSRFLEHPVIFNKGEGVYLWDTEGKRYYDGIGGIFVASLGHRHPRLMEAMKRQMALLTLAPPFHGIADVTLEFIKRLGEVSPGNLNYIKSFSGGSESIEAALKLVRQYFKQTGHPDKMKCITNYLSYHGATFAAMAAGGSARKVKFEPQMPGFVKAYSPKQLRDSFSSWEETCRFCAHLLEKTILGEHPDTVGAVLIEPICNTAGIITPTREYFEIIRNVCDRYGIMLIFDEVLTGFGKTGDMFAAQTFGVTPDIICSGKGLSSGAIPMGAFMVREDIADVFYGPEEDDINFAHGHTYAGFPLACAVGIEAINVLEEEKLLERARKMGVYLKGRLEGLGKYGILREVRGKGVLLGVEIVQDAATNKPFPRDNSLGNALKKTSMKNGVILRIDPDWFAVAPPLIMTDAEMEEMCDAIEKSVKDALDIVTRKP
jgi:adenosylmethionine-8-amino-7-oxononanoate aminotransferase